MSHNEYKFGTGVPDATGLIPVNGVIGDLDNVSLTALANTNILQYDSSTEQWQNIAYPNPVTTSQYVLIGRGESRTYADSGYNTNVGQRVAFYDTAPINTISGALLRKTSGTDWTHAVNLPAGKYVLIAQATAEFSSTGYWGLRWQSASGIFSAKAVVGASLTVYAGAPSTVVGQVELTTATDLYVQVSDSVGLATTQGDTIARTGMLYIRKVV
jgi:hypothetical protein